jgi:spore germination protein KC
LSRRGGVALLAVVVLLLATGCWSRVEVNDLAIITMLAVDRSSEKEIQIWLQIAVPANAGAAPGAPGGGRSQSGLPFITVSGKGQTMQEAARRIQMQMPRRLFWAHTRVVIIGERLARSGLLPALDFLTRHRELRLTNFILVSRGDVTELMGATVDLERLPAEYLREISQSRIGAAATVGDLARTLASEGADPVLGVGAVVHPTTGAVEGQRPSIALSGSALFRRDRLVGYLNDRDTRGLLWLRNEVRRGVVTASVPGIEGAFSVEWTHGSVERKARWENGRIVLYVTARMAGDLGDEQLKVDLSDPAMLRRLEGQVATDIRDRMKEALDRMRKLRIDAAGFGEVVHRQLPGVWKRVQKEWRSRELERLKVVISVDARIQRTGLSNKPRGVKEEQLKKEGE